MTTFEDIINQSNLSKKDKESVIEIKKLYCLDKSKVRDAIEKCTDEFGGIDASILIKELGCEKMLEKYCPRCGKEIIDKDGVGTWFKGKEFCTCER